MLVRVLQPELEPGQGFTYYESLKTELSSATDNEISLVENNLSYKNDEFFKSLYDMVDSRYTMSWLGLFTGVPYYVCVNFDSTLSYKTPEEWRDFVITTIFGNNNVTYESIDAGWQIVYCNNYSTVICNIDTETSSNRIFVSVIFTKDIPVFDNINFYNIDDSKIISKLNRALQEEAIYK